jgi:hypothetical protein
MGTGRRPVPDIPKEKSKGALMAKSNGHQVNEVVPTGYLTTSFLMALWPPPFNATK